MPPGGLWQRRDRGRIRTVCPPLCPGGTVAPVSKVLIVDDQAAIRVALRLLCELKELETLEAASPAEVPELIAREDVGVVVQDMNFSPERTSGQEGIDLFRAIRKLDPDLPVLLLTAYTSLRTAVELVKEGAADYVEKPWNDERLALTLQNLLKLRSLQVENRRLHGQHSMERRELARRFQLCGTVYGSVQMQAAISLAVHVAASDAPILITGPSGAGKEKLAEIVQANSRRKEEPFLKVNVGALPDELLEAELFGAEAGAFTGAAKARTGRFEAASGGTLFLDEIGNLSLKGQARLLRVLQSGEFERLGSSATRKVDVRVISATNVDLVKAIAAGQFREDLYYRLNVIEIALPPLGDRLEDVLPLSDHFLPEFAAGKPLSLDAHARAALLHHGWPGNVRELRNRLQRGALVSRDGVITAADLGFAATSPVTPEEGGSLGQVERATIESALEAANGVISRAASELGLSRQALYRRMTKLGIVMRTVKG